MKKATVVAGWVLALVAVAMWLLAKRELGEKRELEAERWEELRSYCRDQMQGIAQHRREGLGDLAGVLTGDPDSDWIQRWVYREMVESVRLCLPQPVRPVHECPGDGPRKPQRDCLVEHARQLEAAISERFGVTRLP